MIEVEEKREIATGNSPSRVKVWKLFDRISKRYDLLNRLLSFNRDVRWRREVVNHLNDSNSQFVLDLATGTADLLITLCTGSGKVDKGIGIDPAVKMMEIGRKKIYKNDL
ncbi:MAG: class I SAM-dependent methyltransferase, partial [bacterium]|nr:class I SAM-dependent methyltransferase [bacterium]